MVFAFYNVKQAAEEHQEYKVLRTNSTHTNTLRNTSDNGFSSSSGSDYSYGVSAAVVMPREIRSNQKSKNYSFNLTE